MPDQLNPFDTQYAANVREPETVLRRHWIRQVICTAGAVGSTGNLQHSIDNVIDRNKIQRLTLDSEHPQRQPYEVTLRCAAAQALERSPQGANERVDSVKMGDTP